MLPIRHVGVAIALSLCSCSPTSARRVDDSAMHVNPASVPVGPTGIESAATTLAEGPLSRLPYSPGLDVSSMDRSVDPCVDLYEFSCGGWKRNNPIPSDQTKWSVYKKLGDEVRRHLWGLLIEAAKPSVTHAAGEKQLGNYFTACMDEATIDAKGATPLRPALESLAAVRDLAGLTKWLAQGAFAGGGGLLYRLESEQDALDSTQYIATVNVGELGLPDRDDYLTSDSKAVQLRERYHAHVERLLGLLGDDRVTARGTADLVLRLESDLAKASLTRVERRDPHETFHRMALTELEALAPAVAWRSYLEVVGSPQAKMVNVSQPRLLHQISVLLGKEPLDSWKRYLRWHSIRKAAHLLSRPFVQEDFAFYGTYLRGAESLSPRWKRCVSSVDGDLGDALGEVFVKKNFSPQLKSRAQGMVVAIQSAMEKELDELVWMSPTTKKEARIKLRGIVSKIGYPEKFRDYSAVAIASNDFFGNVVRSSRFEEKRLLSRLGKPIDRDEWQEPPQTVNAFYDERMNDITFSAAALLPPLFDPRMDDAPNYGNTGGTFGHELIHAFDDAGRKSDAKGNLRDWWTKADAAEFNARAKCISDQYSSYIAIDDVHVNGKLTLGEDLADLGGLVLAYRVWAAQHEAERSAKEPPLRDGLTPAQRFFVGYAQWDCANIRPETERLFARTDEHSPPRYRINGVVVNMREYAQAFSCTTGQPMVKPEAKVCKVW